MSTELNFDATQVDPTNHFDPLPAQTYRAHVTESEVKDTRAGNGGKYLQLTWEVLDGEYKGRKFWDRINIRNPNVQAQQIGEKQLSQLCHAAGVLRLTSSTQLHHIPVLVKLTIKPGGEGYEPQNEVKSYKSANAEALAGGNSAPAAPTQAAPSARATTPPWAKKAG